MDNYQAIIDILKKHHKYPFTFYNIDINEYVLANYFWLNILKNYFDMSDWRDYGEVYLNYDNDSEISIPIIKVFNYKKKKILILNHMGNYEEKFKDPYFLVGTGMIEVDLDNNITDDFYALDIGVDLRNDKSLNCALDFIKKFIDEDISLEKMEILIDAFDQEYETEFERK